MTGREPSGAVQKMSEASLALARKFCPVVLFDSREEIRPARLEEYLAASCLRDINTHVLIAKTGIDSFDPDVISRTDTYLDYQGSWEAVTQDVEDVPFYVRVDEEVVHRGERLTSIIYMFFWPHDLGGLIAGKRVGSHKADLEHVRVLLSRDGSRVRRVHFAAHGYNEGRWMDANDCQFSNEKRQRIVVYCARNQHASYPLPGKHNRLFFVVPDYADGKGWKWNAASAAVEPYPQQLLNFKGKLSLTIENGPCQRWWSLLEPETTTVCRFTGGVVSLAGVNGWWMRRKSASSVVAVESDDGAGGTVNQTALVEEVQETTVAVKV